MSEPTIRLPLTVSGYGIRDAGGTRLGRTALVSLVNSQAERIRGLTALLDDIPDADEDYITLVRWCARVRAALDKAGKEGA